MRLPGLLVALTIAPCSSTPAERTRVAGLVRYHTLYSAFDGEHDYRVVVNVLPKLVREAILDQDPDSRIDWTSVRWTTDPAFAAQADYPLIAGAASLTTKRAGKTRVAVSFETTAGLRLQSEATLVISAASPDEWQAGDDYFKRSEPIVRPPPENRGACGLPETVEPPYTRNCLNCHDSASSLGGAFTPLEMADHPDEELIAALADGAEPPRGYAPDNFIGLSKKHGADTACLFARFHSADEIDDETARGLLWKLRSLAPEVPKNFDPELLNDIKPDSGL